MPSKLDARLDLLTLLLTCLISVKNKNLKIEEIKSEKKQIRFADCVSKTRENNSPCLQCKKKFQTSAVRRRRKLAAFL